MASTAGRIENASNYDSDFFGWACEQARLLRERRFTEADIDNIAEEIESLARSEKRELVNRLSVLLAHLLKWQLQPRFRGNSWRLTVKEQRSQLEDHLAESPSLRPSLEQVIARAYGNAVLATQKEIGSPESAFPATCPYTKAQIFDPAFLPG